MAFLSYPTLEVRVFCQEFMNTTGQNVLESIDLYFKTSNKLTKNRILKNISSDKMHFIKLLGEHTPSDLIALYSYSRNRTVKQRIFEYIFFCNKQVFNALIEKLEDAELIILYTNTVNKTIKDEVFRLLIERVRINGKARKSWKDRIENAAGAFLNKNLFMLTDYDTDTLYNIILMNLFDSLRKTNYDTKRSFYSYFNNLIKKTLLNVRRVVNKKNNKTYNPNQQCKNNFPTTIESLDDEILWEGQEMNKHEVIASNYNIEEEFERRELVHLILDKCRKHFNNDQQSCEIFIRDDITNQLRNGELAQKYGCSKARVSSTKKRKIKPQIHVIREELIKELR